jgi:hypothetical protein
MRILFDRLRQGPLETVTWIESIGTSGNLIFSNPNRVSENDISLAISKALEFEDIEQPTTVRTAQQLESTIRAFDRDLSKIGKKAVRENSNVEVLSDGVVKAGIGFMISKPASPVEFEYPKALTRAVSLVSTFERDVHFLWKRTDGAYGVPNRAIESWLGAKATSRAYSIVCKILCRMR